MNFEKTEVDNGICPFKPDIWNIPDKYNISLFIESVHMTYYKVNGYNNTNISNEKILLKEKS